MICSFIDGRVRIRAAALKNSEKMALVENMIKTQQGVLGTLSNTRTGSLLVQYDPETLSRDMLLMASKALEAELGEDKASKGEPKGRTCARRCYGSFPRLFVPKTEMALLTAAFGATLAGVFFNKQLHLGAGLLFSLLAAKHVYCRRR